MEMKVKNDPDLAFTIKTKLKMLLNEQPEVHPLGLKTKSKSRIFFWISSGSNDLI